MDERLREWDEDIKFHEADISAKIAVINFRKDRIKTLRIRKLKHLEHLIIIKIASDRKEIRKAMLQEKITIKNKKATLILSETGNIEYFYYGETKKMALEYKNKNLIDAIKIKEVCSLMESILKVIN